MEKNILKKILENHLFLEFSMHGNTHEGIQNLFEGYDLLLEKYGIIPNINTYARRALNYFKSQIKGIKNVKTVRLTDNIFSDIDNCFFKNVNVVLTYTYSEDKKGSDASTNLFSIDTLTMDIYVTSNHENFDSEFLSIFAHELTHIYENYQRIKNNDKNSGLFNALTVSIISFHSGHAKKLSSKKHNLGRVLS